MQPRLALLASTALSATYPVTLKLIYAADGAALSPASITSLRFALMAGGAALVLSESSSPAASEPQGEPLSTPLSTPLTEPPNESAAFWRAAAELGFWACAGAQLNTAGLQQIGVVRGTLLLSTINVFTPYVTELSNPRTAASRQERRLADPWQVCYPHARALAGTGRSQRSSARPRRSGACRRACGRRARSRSPG